VDNIISKNGLRQGPIVRFFIALTLSFLLGGCFLYLSIKQFMFLIIGSLIIITCFLSIRNGLSLLILATIVVPTTGVGGLNYATGIEISGKNIKVIEIIFIAIILSWGFQLILKNINPPDFKRNKPYYLFYLFLILSLLIDYLLHNNLQDTIVGASHLLYYGIYFVIVTSIHDLKNVKILYNMIIIGALFHSFIIISMYIWPSNPLWQYTYWQGITRASFREGIALVFGLALLFTRFFLSSRARERIFCILLIIPILFSLIMGQQRAGWVAFVIFIIMLFMSLIYKRELSVKKAVKVCIASFPIVIILFIGVNSRFGPREEIGLELIVNRFTTFENIQTDSSFVYRLKKAKDSFYKIRKNPFWGEGFSKYNELQIYGEVFIDNTHIPLLRKIGLVGYILFLWIFFRFFKKVAFIFRFSTDKISKEFSITFISLIPSIVLLTFTCAYLVSYNFTFIFATLMALAEVIARKVENSSNNTLKINRRIDWQKEY